MFRKKTGFTQISRSLRFNQPEGIVAGSHASYFYFELLQEASYRSETITYNGREIKLKAGQLLYSQRSMADYFGISHMTLRGWENKLRKWWMEHCVCGPFLFAQIKCK